MFEDRKIDLLQHKESEDMSMHSKYLASLSLSMHSNYLATRVERNLAITRGNCNITQLFQNRCIDTNCTLLHQVSSHHLTHQAHRAGTFSSPQNDIIIAQMEKKFNNKLSICGQV